MTKNTSKNIQKFECKLCEYSCSKKGDWNRHLQTRKHKLVTNSDEKTSKNIKSYICECGKIYKHRQNLHTHKMKCNYKKCEIIDNDENEEDISYKKMYMNIVEENKELRGMVKNMIPNIGNNNNNKNFNVNVFLNENCKDAVNLMDFVNGLQFKMEDVEDMGKLGFVESTSKIFINGLKELEYTKRPVHCSDIKQETLYIKDNNMWEQDNDNNDKMKHAIDEITKANMNNIPQWIRDNPTFGSDDQCLRIISNIMKIQEGMNNDEKKQIINNIAKETLIDK
jgi:hypothetical protein